jgi:hypothetical protein
VWRWSGARVVPMGGGQFTAGDNKLRFSLDKDGAPVFAETIDSEGEVTRYFPEHEWTPAPADLAPFKGDWFSEEAGAMFTVAVEGDKAYIKQRPATSLPMQPLYKDHFSVQGFILWFTRDKDGKVNTLHVGASRMRDMPFVRVK